MPAKQKGLLNWFWMGICSNHKESGYADITEVRTVTGAATCNQLLAAGWVLLGVYPLTTVAEMTQGGEQQKQDTQRYVRRFVGYVVGKKRE